jgi:hypothetical protein
VARKLTKKSAELPFNIELEDGTAYYMGSGLFVVAQAEQGGPEHQAVISLEDMRRMVGLMATAGALSGLTSNCALDLARAA